MLNRRCSRAATNYQLRCANSEILLVRCACALYARADLLGRVQEVLQVMCEECECVDDEVCECVEVEV